MLSFRESLVILIKLYWSKSLFLTEEGYGKEQTTLF